MPIHETEQELNEMLDEGVHVEITDIEEGAYRLRVVVDDQACADCLVPDGTLESIASDSLRRRGAQVTSMSVEHGP